ncbi:MAG: Mobile element protein [Gemmatimonadetes bacterium]|nr:Mobile element protein [Gemmatimonadota bacterium]
MNKREKAIAKRDLLAGALDRRGETFRYRVMVDGESFSATIATADLTAAIANANAMYREQTQTPGAAALRRARRVAGLSGTIRMRDLLDEFELSLAARVAGTQRSYRDSLRPIREYFVTVAGNPAIASIRARDVDAYLDWRRLQRGSGTASRYKLPTTDKRPVAPRTLAKDRAVLHRLFAVADRKEYRQGNPVARTEAPKGDTRSYVILNAEEYDRLLAQCEHDAMLLMYVTVLGEVGCRANSEALMLQWSDIDLEGGFVRIESGRDGRRTKSGKSHWTPITQRLDAALRRHFAAFRFAGSPWLFHHTTAQARRTKGDRIKSLYYGFKAAAQRAGLPKALRQHDLRHRRVTTWLAEGANPVHVKEALGHSDLRVTMAYTHLSREHLRSLVAPKITPKAERSEIA